MVGQYYFYEQVFDRISQSLRINLWLVSTTSKSKSLIEYHNQRTNLWLVSTTSTSKSLIE